MEQKSDVQFRAEKLYKNSREKFGYLIREVVSNAIHATLIRDKCVSDPNYTPEVKISINQSNDLIQITVEDNGDGFTDLNRKYFTHLDTKNPQKEKLQFHPMGQGRLAIVYFSDEANYKSVYKKNDEFFEKNFNYPETSLTLFDIEGSDAKKSDEVVTGTILTLQINKQQTYKRANTFLSKYPDAERLKYWFIENFFPFFMENEKFRLSITLNGETFCITRSYIEKNIASINFSIRFDVESDTLYEFKIWLIEKDETPKSKNQIACFARHLRAEIETEKIEYEIDLPVAYDWFLTSKYFDDRVDQKGDKIEISLESVEKIRVELTAALDMHFASQIEINRTRTKENILAAEEKFPSLFLFMEDKSDSSRKILKENELITDAIDNKGKAEKNYWLNQESETDETEKLLNSSLHIYIDHRKRILLRLRELIRKFDEVGEVKNEPEDDIHDLFLKRGHNLRTTANKNHLHNLWILDDKYTIFSETFGGQSTKRGQEASDIYLWADDPERPRELLILELKSTSHAHNAGNKYESMVAQVKRYASKFYKDPQKLLNWNVDANNILYFGVILARKSDVYKEVGSNNVGGKPIKIPFLSASYFFNDEFAINDSDATAPRFKDIRIEMYAYEDILQLASSRNDVFLRLLKGEFRLGNEDNKQI